MSETSSSDSSTTEPLSSGENTRRASTSTSQQTTALLSPSTTASTPSLTTASPLSPDDLEQFTLDKTHIDSLAVLSAYLGAAYTRRGQIWHGLPLQQRFHALLLPSITTHCALAFTVKPHRELPFLIQAFGAVGYALEEAKEALERTEFEVVDRLERVVEVLLMEVEEHVADLGRCLDVIGGVGWLCELSGEAQQWEKRHREKKKIRDPWCKALPKVCMGDEVFGKERGC